MKVDNTFSEIVGQHGPKRKLQEFVKVYNATRMIPPILTIAPRGYGKSMLCRATGQRLLNSEGNAPKHFVEINCAKLKNTQQFFDQFLKRVVFPNASRDALETTIFFDEASEIPRDLTFMLLTILETNESGRVVYNYQDEDFCFDLRKISWFFATTEPQKVFHALKDRTERIDFEEYTKEELGEILLKHMKEVSVDEKLLPEISTVLRGNPRAAVHLAKKMKGYLLARNKVRFTKDDWKALCHTFDIKPLGLSPFEVTILRFLQKYGEQSLTNLSAKSDMSAEALRQDCERYLLKHHLMQIGQRGRVITRQGLEVLRRVDEVEKPKLLTAGRK